MQKPELNTVLSNIGSLVDEAKMMIDSEAAVPEEKPEEEAVEPELAKSILKWLKAQEGEEEEEKEDDEEMAKSDEGTHGDDKAEDVIDDIGEVNQKNINEVAKAIVRSLIGMKKVEKAQPKERELKKSLDMVNKELTETRQALSYILEGMGIAEQIKVQGKVEKSMETRVPNDQNEIKKTLETIMSQLNQKAEDTVQKDGSGSLRKSLTENNGAALVSLFRMNAK